MTATAAPHTNLCLYLHTHWDREWYQPFEVYRASLVKVVSEIVDRLNTGALEYFLLDGQASVLDDVLEIKPELANDIKALMKQGRLNAGPWYVLADQLLVSGESLIRNLKLGIAVTEKLGPAAMIGYSPDTFGHTADMPRLLRGFDIRTAFVWRGVPELASGPVFRWQSPDGNQVIAYQLAKGYYQTTFHTESDNAKLDAYLRNWVKDAQENAATTYSPFLNHVLVPVGGDHVAPPVDIAEKLAVLANQPKGKGERAGGAIKAIRLPDFASLLLDEIAPASLPVIEGELRDNLAAKRFERAYVLQGVLSTRLYLKRENRLAERRITRVAEPLLSLLRLTRGTPYPEDELGYAWKLLLQNQPHDSICGCSVDEVHDEMQMRTRKFNQVLDALGADAVAALFNANANADAGAGAAVAPAVTAALAPLTDPSLLPDKLVLANLCGEPVVQPVPLTWATPVSEPISAGSFLRLESDRGRAIVQVASSQISAEIFVGTGKEPIVKRVRVNRGWVWTDGLLPMAIAELPWSSPVVSDEDAGELAVKAGKRSLSNQWLLLEIASDGALSVTVRHAATGESEAERFTKFVIAHKIRDLADCGDTYNFDPLPGDRPIYARLVDVRSGLPGPLVASLQLFYEIAIPRELTATSLSEESDQPVPEKPGVFTRSKQLELHRIVTEVTIKRGVPILFFETRWENKSSDHRLEVVFGTGKTVDTTFSENHFSILSRKAAVAQSQLPVEAGTEAVPDRFPCQRFFIANDQMFLNLGLPEYGADGSEVSITLLRAVSRLSRPRLNTRGGGAGPPVPTPKANCLGVNTVSYAFAPLRSALAESGREQAKNQSAGAKAGHRKSEPAVLSDAARIEAYSLADLYEAPLFAALARGTNPEPGKVLIACDNAAVKITAMYFSEADNALVVRFLNTSTAEQQATICTQFAVGDARICRLDETPVQTLKRLPSPSAEQGQFSARLEFSDNQLLTVKFLLSKADNSTARGAGYNQGEKATPKQSPAGRSRVRSK